MRASDGVGAGLGGGPMGMDDVHPITSAQGRSGLKFAAYSVREDRWIATGPEGHAPRARFDTNRSSWVHAGIDHMPIGSLGTHRPPDGAGVYWTDWEVPAARATLAPALRLAAGSDEGDTGKPASRASDGADGAGTGAKILVVDDVADNRRHLSRRLQRRGYRVVEAASGEETLELLSDDAGDIEVVLLDIMMPGMDGIEVLHRLRQRHSPLALPIIMVTAKTGGDDVIEALNAGANDYVTKPIELPVTVARMETHRNLRHLNERLRDREQRYALVAASATDALWEWDLTTEGVRFSPRWYEMLGLEAQDGEVSPDTWLDRVHPDDVAAVRAALDEHIQGQSERVRVEYRVQHGSGSYLWVALSAMCQRDGEDRPVRLVGSQTDVTAAKSVDALTGLSNRVMLEQWLEQLLARGLREEGLEFAVIFLDLNGFKPINDTYGHSCGDDVLLTIAQRLQDSVRSHDLVARIGGDEFVVVAEGGAQRRGVAAAAERLLRRVNEPMVAEGRRLQVSASLGIAMYPSDGMDSTTLIEHADGAMYRAKTIGWNHYEFYDPAITSAVATRLQAEQDLRNAVEGRRLAFHYAEQHLLSEQRPAGCRIEVTYAGQEGNPHGGSTRAALVLAGQAGLATTLGLRSIEDAVGRLARWREAGIELDHVVVDATGAQLRDPEFPGRAAAVCHGAGVAPWRLILALAGDTVDSATLAQRMRALHALDLRIAVEMFGPFGDTVAELDSLAADFHILPPALVDGLPQLESRRAMAEAVVRAGRALDRSTMAFGVDRAEQASFLAAIGCDYASGAYFGEPRDADAFVETLRGRPGA